MYGYIIFRSINFFYRTCHVGGIISLPWFSKEMKNDLSKKNLLRGVILILLVRETIFVGWRFPFPIVLVPRYKLSLCHTPIKPNLLGFLGIDVFACGLHDHMITRFTSTIHHKPFNSWKKSQYWGICEPFLQHIKTHLVFLSPFKFHSFSSQSGERGSNSRESFNESLTIFAKPKKLQVSIIVTSLSHLKIASTFLGSTKISFRWDDIP
jgi:hypothetical protein